MNRLLSSGRRPFVVIEGDLRRCDLYESSLSAWLNLSLRGDVSVLRTTSVRETFQVIVALVSKLEAPPGKWTPSADGGVRPPKLVGKRQKDAACVDVRQLMCVPSISYKIAKTLLDQFGSLSNLRKALLSEPFPAVRLDERHCLGRARIKHLRRHVLGEDDASNAAKQKHPKTNHSRITIKPSLASLVCNAFLENTKGAQRRAQRLVQARQEWHKRGAGSCVMASIAT